MFKKKHLVAIVSIASASFLIGTVFNFTSVSSSGSPWDIVWTAIFELQSRVDYIEEYVYNNVEIISAEELQGKPTFDVGYDLGVYVWIEDENWHIRWTGDSLITDNIYVIEFNITTNGNFMNVQEIDFELDDFLLVQTGKELSGRCSFADYYDGLDFNVIEGTEVTFDLKISEDSSLSKWLEMTDEQKGQATLQMGVHYDPYLIFLGKNNINPNKPMVKVTL